MSAATNKAVFLSYASQDAEAARRLCEALRAAGVEVWFDQSELVGGDAWDAKIRGQIASCALFVPVISASTQARREGYFRLEWKLAAQRTHMMSERTSFLLPVVIDATGDKEADVPSEFRAVQWTRLPGGESSPAFCTRVQALLESGTGISPVISDRRQDARATPAGGTPAHSRPRSRWITPAAVLVVAIVALAVWRPWNRAQPIASGNAAEKSVAVLPFVNLSGDPAQEYFSDGLTEEILNALARERDLHVPGRASSFSFKGTKATPVEIARALNVTRLVEGSVRRDGKRVRISFQLTRAADGFSEDTGTFTEEVTDIFALQDKVARAVVEKLTRRSTTAPVTVLTTNPAAYDAYLRGRALQTRAAGFRYKAAEYYEQAVAADPTFALAWARLADARFRDYRAFFDWRPATVEATRTAIANALKAKPDLPEALVVRGTWHRLVTCDYAAAQQDLDRAAALQPPTGELRHAQALLALDRGDAAQCVKHLREALALDPENGDQANSIANTLQGLGELRLADELYLRAIRIQGPDQEIPFWNRVNMRARWRGPEAALRLIERAPPEQKGSRELKSEMLLQLNRPAEARASIDQVAVNALEGKDLAVFQDAEGTAWVVTAVGDDVRARQLWERLRTLALNEVNLNNLAPRVRQTLVRAEAALGHHAEAVRALKSWQEDFDRIPSDDRRRGEFGRFAVACFAQLGMVDEAIGMLRELQTAPAPFADLFGMNLRRATHFAPLRGDPRFQEIVERAEAWATAQPDPVDP